MSDFDRVNRPRIERIMKQLTLIEKSALSYRADPAEFQDLLAPLFEKFRPAEKAEQPAQEKKQADDVAPAVAREVSRLADLSTQQLVDRMIACGAELASRRK